MRRDWISPFPTLYLNDPYGYLVGRSKNIVYDMWTVAVPKNEMHVFYWISHPKNLALSVSNGQSKVSNRSENHDQYQSKGSRYRSEPRRRVSAVVP